MTADQRSQLIMLRNAVMTPPSREPVSQWCERHLTIPPPTGPGRLNWLGHEYCAEPADVWHTPGVNEIALCFGAQTGKSTLLIACVGWSLSEDPCAMVWAMPNENLARSFSVSRFLPMIEASSVLSNLIPEGNARRTQYTTLQMRLGGSLLNFVGSNSPANTSSRPGRKVIMDEIDKLGEARGGEASATEHLEQRTRAQPMPFIARTSTPTTMDGAIWTAYLTGDQRRYHVPCPYCEGLVVFGWSPKFTVLPLLGCEAWIKWNPECKRDDGSWDLARVQSSAWAECPHCHARIEDRFKSRMVRSGKWIPTALGQPGCRSYHLPSIYAVGVKTSFGALAVDFLTKVRVFEGMQGFINGTLAEPLVSQDKQGERIEVIREKHETIKGALRTMAVDCQLKSPHFWYTVREWITEPAVETILIASGSADTFEEIREIQQKHEVPDPLVTVDSGHGAKSDQAVYVQCARFSDFEERRGKRPMACGWIPSKGMPAFKTWKSKDGVRLPYFEQIVDPFSGTSDGGKVEMVLLEFSGHWFKDLLHELRDPKRAEELGVKWSVTASAATEEYWKHLDAEIKVRDQSRKTGAVKYVWQPRAQRWPNHLLDCEVMQLALAMYHEIYDASEPQPTA